MVTRMTIIEFSQGDNLIYARSWMNLLCTKYRHAAVGQQSVRRNRQAALLRLKEAVVY